MMHHHLDLLPSVVGFLRHMNASTSKGAGSCPNMDMVCPEIGCDAVFPAKSLKRHLAKDCLVAKKRLSDLYY